MEIQLEYSQPSQGGKCKTIRTITITKIKTEFKTFAVCRYCAE
jgi:hypothetical protein